MFSLLDQSIIHAKPQTVPNKFVRLGPTHVVPLLTAQSTNPLGRRSARISDRTQIGVTLMIYQQQTAFGREHMALSSSSIAAIEISSALKPVLILMTNKMNNFDHHVLAAKR